MRQNIFKRFTNLKIAQKIISIVIIIFTFLLFIIVPMQILIYRNDVYNVNVSVMYTIIESYAINSIGPILRNDYATLDEFVKGLQASEYILYASIYDKNGKILTNSSIRKNEIKQKIEIIDIPIMNRDTKIGNIEVCMGVSHFRKIIMNHSIGLISLSVFIFIILMIIMIVMIRMFLLKQIENIDIVMKKISKGDLSQKLPVLSHDEIGNFAAGFNHMISDLKESLAISNCILESSPSTTWVATDTKYNIIMCDSSISQYLSFDSDWNTKDDVTDQGTGDYLSLIGEVLWEKIPFFMKYNLDCDKVLSTGKYIKLYREHLIDEKYIQVFIYPLIEDDNLDGIVLRIDDVTSDESKDVQLRQALKIETLGVLAGGLAHDFNNVLSGISATISILKFKLQNNSEIQNEKLASFVDIIDNSIIRSSDMIKQMLFLSRKQEVEYTPTDLKICISHVSKIANNTFDKSVNIDIKLPEEKAMIMADPSQLESLILNLSINAWHAMTIMRNKDDKWGGNLTIKLEQTLTDKYSKENGYENDKWWLISISDTGVGISKENLNKIFQPFFTTKDKKGTGLGLAMVKDIVEQHNGFMDIYSEVGIGSRFLIYLPIMNEENFVQLIDESYNIVKGNQEMILVADDEPIVCEVIKHILEEANYQSIIVNNGYDCIDNFLQKQNQIALVMLDMSMPEINGIETFYKLKEIKSDLKVLICSGFSLQKYTEQFKNEGVTGVIEKPYTLFKVSKAINDALK